MWLQYCLINYLDIPQVTKIQTYAVCTRHEDQDKSWQRMILWNMTNDYMYYIKCDLYIQYSNLQNTNIFIKKFSSAASLQ